MNLNTVKKKAPLFQTDEASFSYFPVRIESVSDF